MAPSEDAIRQFIEFTNSDRSEAIRRLNNANDNVSEAVISFFNAMESVRYTDSPLPPYFAPPTATDYEFFQGNDPGPTTSSWVEEQFSSGREGDMQGHENLPSFQINASDDVPMSSYPVTRPPSRVSQNDSIRSHQTNVTEIDDAAPFARMESGVHFGPAQREHYDTGNWSLQRYSNSGVAAEEIMPDPEPSARRRVEGEPVFMKPLPSSADYLPSLVTILGSIPLAYSSMLDLGNDPYDYGHNPQWWSGSPIEVPQVRDLDSNEDPNRVVNVLVETQRLMAFLRHSERSYGSVAALSSMPYIAEQQDEQGRGGTNTPANKFIQAWVAAATEFDLPRHGIAPAELFSSVASDQHPNQDPEHHQFHILSLPLSIPGPETPESMYDALDKLLWESDTDGSEEGQISLTKAAEVFPILVSQRDANCHGLNMEVPAEWFADRYLSSNASATKSMRRELAQWMSKISHVEDNARKLATYNNDETGQHLDALKMMEEALPDLIWNSKRRKDEFSFTAESVMIPEEPDETTQASPEAGQLQLLQETLNGFKKRIQVFEEQKKALQMELSRASDLLKKPGEGTDAGPMTRYSLCGAATDPSTTYVRRIKETSKDQMPAEQQSEWWEMKYITTSSTIISKKIVSVADVLRAASQDSNLVLLVYATDKALAAPVASLPDGLPTFIALDNAAFAEEERNAMQVDGWDAPPYDASLEDTPWAPDTEPGLDDRSYAHGDNAMWPSETWQPAPGSYTVEDGTSMSVRENMVIDDESAPYEEPIRAGEVGVATEPLGNQGDAREQGVAEETFVLKERDPMGPTPGP
ncbi:hypothetical protein K402DRAFT_398782 [Aulographum hederae CBS 113979]|uniref:Ubiquitin interaction motif protein n=1 Tax=Aulographum hederae CBS 113979 TaxID=1176131 RepID=A0A6G1GK11_9PEZI|nr:hypothetical protein K402DRAFT_398782 [Aulographum hederae CBS 113979]